MTPAIASKQLLVGIGIGQKLIHRYTPVHLLTGQRALLAAKKNLLSAQANPQVVEGYLAKEVTEGRVVEITDETSMPGLQISPFGVIPKKSSPGNWRLIIDLSSPDQHSVNDGIPKELCSLSYCSVDDAVHQVLRLGKSAKLAKLDVKNAFRLLPIHPADRPLLGMCWNGQIFVDKTLPFGLRSAPKLFNAVADALQWVMEQRGVSFVIHYLDDFLTSGAPNSDECDHNFQVMLQIFKELGVPFSLAKCEGPATILTFLGIEIDTVKQELRLPAEKLMHADGCKRQLQCGGAGRSAQNGNYCPL